MRNRIAIVVGLLALTLALGWALPASAQGPRADAIWARAYASTITLDGVLNEPGWAKAESTIVRFGRDAGIPGSGWKMESGNIPTDSTYAVLKFLTQGDQLYLGARILDKSVGGSKDFNRFDGLLMCLKDHTSLNAPKPPAEYLYSWWYPGPTSVDPQPVGQLPCFIGRWGNNPPTTPRTAEQIAAWDAVTTVQGTSNTDATNDTGYTVEMRFNVAYMGYHINRAEGDIVEWNVSIYDCDWFWPYNMNTFSACRTWWQGPWGNAAWYDEVRIYAKPSITTNTVTLPNLAPELYVANGVAQPTPVIDGQLTETAWNLMTGFDIRYGDDALRQTTYPGVMASRGGQYQPPVNGGQAAILDPGDATVKMFFKGDWLYMGFDVRDQSVQFHPSFDRWDGFLVSLNDRATRGPDQNLIGRRLSFQVNQDGTALAHDYLATMVAAGTANVAIALKPGTTVDTTGVIDTGYTAELAINLPALGYPVGLGDGALFLGVDLLDGDSPGAPEEAYGTRTWWGREYENECCPAWAYLDPALLVASDVRPTIPVEQAGGVTAWPNPFHGVAGLRYALPATGRVTLEVFDVQGRLVERRPLGVQPAGVQYAAFDGARQAAGVYLCRVQVADPGTGEVRSTLTGRMQIVK
jgi:hypothetical protein